MFPAKFSIKNLFKLKLFYLLACYFYISINREYAFENVNSRLLRGLKKKKFKIPETINIEKRKVKRKVWWNDSNESVNRKSHWRGGGNVLVFRR